MQNVPASLEKCYFTRLGGGEKALLEVTAKSDTTVRIATATDQEPVDLTGWSPAPLVFQYGDRNKTRLHVFTHPLAKGKTLTLPRGNWSGPLLIFNAD